MSRTPALRELRRNLPQNVVILPTAARRQVEQRWNDVTRAAKQELIASQAVKFPYQLPFWREANRQAQSLELRAGVPTFDPTNPAHLRAWEAFFDFAHRQSDKE